MHDRVKQQLSDIISSLCVGDYSELSEGLHFAILDSCWENPDSCLNRKTELSRRDVVITTTWAENLLPAIALDEKKYDVCKPR